MLKFVINPATKIFLLLRVIAVAIPVCLLLELLKKKKKDRNFISLIVKTKTLIVNSSKAASPQMLA